MTNSSKYIHMNRHRQIRQFQRADDVAELFQAFRKVGINPGQWAAAHASNREGIELPGKVQEALLHAAIRRAARPYAPESVPEAEAVLIGNQPIAEEVLSSGILVIGATGAGKTRLFYQLLDQCYSKRKRATFWDGKGEGRRFHQRWRDSMLFTARDAPWQWLEPPPGCDPLFYFIGMISQLRTEFELRSETFPLAHGIYERIVRGLRPGDPYPSWSDFRRVLEHEAAVTGRENLYTLARVFLNIETALGPNARVRRVPADVSDLCLIQDIEMVGLDVSMFRVFFGMHFNKLLHAAHNEEHTTGLRSLEIIDEAGPLCSVELVQRNAPTINSLAQFATMSRFMGRALVVGAQNISQVHPLVKNAGTIVCFRAPSVVDAVDAARMLGLPPESTDELMRLNVREAYMRSVGWPQPVKIEVPVID
jgi:hypothetical protein